MDQNQPVPSTPVSTSNVADANAANAQQEVPQAPVAKKKTNAMVIILILLFIVASIVTAAIYFLLPDQKQYNRQQAQYNTGTGTGTSTSVDRQNPQLQDKTPWTTYSDQPSGYFFYYPETWKLEKDKTNPNKFVLREDGSTPGEITGEFMSKEQFSKETKVTCTPATTTTQNPCFVYEKTASSSAYVHATVDTNNNVTSAIAYITRPGGAGFLFKITQPNIDSYDVLSNVVDTLQFSNERRIVPLLVCPDDRSADKETVTYRGITLPASDVDEAWIQKNCH